MVTYDRYRPWGRISIIGHSEGTIIAPRVAIDNWTEVKNIYTYGYSSSEPSRHIALSDGIVIITVRYTIIR